MTLRSLRRSGRLRRSRRLRAVPPASGVPSRSSGGFPGCTKSCRSSRHMQRRKMHTSGSTIGESSALRASSHIQPIPQSLALSVLALQDARLAASVERQPRARVPQLRAPLADRARRHVLRQHELAPGSVRARDERHSPGTLCEKRLGSTCGPAPPSQAHWQGCEEQTQECDLLPLGHAREDAGGIPAAGERAGLPACFEK